MKSPTAPRPGIGATIRIDAARIASKFTTTILDNFLRDGTIREKYNVASGSANVKVATGYKSNVVGFGWTNAVYLKLEDILSEPATTQTTP